MPATWSAFILWSFVSLLVIFVGSVFFVDFEGGLHRRVDP